MSPSSLVNSGKPAAAAATEFPAFVHVPADQAADPNAAEDWWYAAGHLSSGGHEYGYQVQLVASGISQLSITDVTAGKYYTQSVTYKAGQFSVSDAELDVRMPDDAVRPGGSCPRLRTAARPPAPSGTNPAPLKGGAMEPAITGQETMGHDERSVHNWRVSQLTHHGDDPH